VPQGLSLFSQRGAARWWPTDAPARGKRVKPNGMRPSTSLAAPALGARPAAPSRDTFTGVVGMAPSAAMSNQPTTTVATLPKDDTRRSKSSTPREASNLSRASTSARGFPQPSMPQQKRRHHRCGLGNSMWYCRSTTGARQSHRAHLPKRQPSSQHSMPLLVR